MKVADTPDSASTISMTNTITITVEQDGYYDINGSRQEPIVNLQLVTGASKLRRQLKESNELIICPGVYDGLSARIAMNLGFKAMYMVTWLLPPLLPPDSCYKFPSPVPIIIPVDALTTRFRPEPALLPPGSDRQIWA